MGNLSAIFKALSDPLRLRILRLLLTNGREAYGEELARALRIPAYRLSRHLKVLKVTGLVHERRVGRWVYYSLAKRNGQLLGMLRRLIAEAEVSISEQRRRPVKAPGLRRPVVRRRRGEARHAKEFNWNQGPAVPGIL
jgi:DNA-binding transcriptional ArsR family regulator